MKEKDILVLMVIQQRETQELEYLTKLRASTKNETVAQPNNYHRFEANQHPQYQADTTE